LTLPKCWKVFNSSIDLQILFCAANILWRTISTLLKGYTWTEWQFHMAQIQLHNLLNLPYISHLWIHCPYFWPLNITFMSYHPPEPIARHQCSLLLKRLCLSMQTVLPLRLRSLHSKHHHHHQQSALLQWKKPYPWAL
jgi:hypothetical protein